MVLKADCRDALVLALERGVAGEPQAGKWHFFNAHKLPGLDDDWKKALLCEQAFRPEFLALEKSGHICEFDGNPTGNALFLLGRSRKWNEHQIATIWNQLEMGARLIISGDKAGGIGSIRKWFGKHTEIADSFSKHHAVVFWADKLNASDNIPVSEITREVEGYRVQEGMFSSDGPDHGSKLLVEHFDHRIRGRIADFGAGWGYLSGELLNASDRVESIDLFEADKHALTFAVKNIQALNMLASENISYKWCDVTTEFQKKPYDWVIMNPPFHSGGRAAEPELGKRFIEVASSTLPSGGRLLMVANKNLPYEKALEAKFRRFEKLGERDGFKVFEAVR